MWVFCGDKRKGKNGWECRPKATVLAEIVKDALVMLLDHYDDVWDTLRPQLTSDWVRRVEKFVNDAEDEKPSLMRQAERDAELVLYNHTLATA
jgi:hypothetical protein